MYVCVSGHIIIVSQFVFELINFKDISGGISYKVQLFIIRKNNKWTQLKT